MIALDCGRIGIVFDSNVHFAIRNDIHNKVPLDDPGDGGGLYRAREILSVEYMVND
jgi:hypothetical protein